MHTTPLGDMPGPALAGFTTLDILIHGWDLAKATGQPATLDDALAAHVLAFAGQAITPAPGRPASARHCPSPPTPRSPTSSSLSWAVTREP